MRQSKDIPIGPLAATLWSGAVVAVCLGALPAMADPKSGLYGTPGLIDMPTAEMPSDGTVTLGAALLPESQRFSAGFQMLPRVNLTFRYSGIGDFGGFTESSGYSLWDRSLDLSVLVWPEGTIRPAVVAGVRDVIGTGVLSSEYLVATKHLTPSLALSAGLGWGRLATGNSIGSIGGRPTGDGGDLGGKLRLESLFKGNVGLFGGLRWQTPVQRLSVAVEYSSDDYSAEEPFGVTPAKEPWSIGLNWQPNSNLSFGLAVINGQGLAANLTAVLDPQGPDLWPQARWTPSAAKTKTGGVASFSGSGVTPLGFSQKDSSCTATVLAAGVRSVSVAVQRSGTALAAHGCTTAQLFIAREGLVLSETHLDLSDTDPVVVSSEASGPGISDALATPAFDWVLSPLVRFSESVRSSVYG